MTRALRCYSMTNTNELYVAGNRLEEGGAKHYWELFWIGEDNAVRSSELVMSEAQS